MKRTAVLALFLLLFTISDTFAQKFGYVDTKYIMSQMPDFKEAQAEIEKLSKGWQAEIGEMYKRLEQKEAGLKAEEVLLTQEMKEERRQEIERQWKEVKDYQNQIFGFDGLYFLKKKELEKPVMDQVFEAVERVAKNNRLQFVFDKSGELVMIYTDPIHDYTDFVLEELGLGENNVSDNN